MLTSNPLHAKICHKRHKTISLIHIIPPHWHDTDSWNSSSFKTRTHLSYIVNIMVADALVSCVARASETVILTMLNQDNSAPACWGLTSSNIYVQHCSEHIFILQFVSSYYQINSWCLGKNMKHVDLKLGWSINLGTHLLLLLLRWINFISSIDK